MPPKPALGAHFSKPTGCTIHHVILTVTVTESRLPPGTWQGALHSLAALVSTATQDLGAPAPILWLAKWRLREGGWSARVTEPVPEPLCLPNLAEVPAARSRPHQQPGGLGEQAGPPLKGSLWQRDGPPGGWASGLPQRNP